MATPPGWRLQSGAVASIIPVFRSAKPLYGARCPTIESRACGRNLGDRAERRSLVFQGAEGGGARGLRQAGRRPRGRQGARLPERHRARRVGPAAGRGPAPAQARGTIGRAREAGRRPPRARRRGGRAGRGGPRRHEAGGPQLEEGLVGGGGCRLHESTPIPFTLPHAATAAPFRFLASNSSGLR